MNEKGDDDDDDDDLPACAAPLRRSLLSLFFSLSSLSLSSLLSSLLSDFRVPPLCALYSRLSSLVGVLFYSLEKISKWKSFDKLVQERLSEKERVLLRVV